jgi:hypothetical protein
MSQSDVIYQGVSPNGKFSLEVTRPGETDPYFLATFRCIDGSAGIAEMGTSFGPYPTAARDELAIRWDLPDNVCGLYLGSDCYGLFRFGRSRRRTRGSFRCQLQPPFAEAEIDWFCAKTHTQFRFHPPLV